MKMNNYEVIAAFFVPFIKIKFPKHQDHSFTYYIEKKDHKPLDWEHSVNTTYPNIPDDDTFVTSDQRDELKADLASCISEVFTEMNMPDKIKLKEFWYNIYHDGQGQEPHSHLPMIGDSVPYWCGIYYHQNTTPTVFNRSDRTFKVTEFPDAEKSVLGPCFYQTFCPHVEDGDILLFPAYLEHYILAEEKHRENMRVTFAFNVGLVNED